MANTKRGKTAEQTYRDQLLYALRLRDLPGDRIGEALAEVEAHTAETGEDPREAFGPAKEYAKEIAAAAGVTQGRWRLTPSTVVWVLVIGALSGVSTAMLAGGVLSLVGDEAPDWGLSPGWELTLGIVGALVTTALVTFFSYRSEDPVRDPRTGRTEPLPRWVLPVVFLGLYAAAAATFAVVAALS